jgi:hypothetical protein
VPRQAKLSVNTLRDAWTSDTTVSQLLPSTPSGHEHVPGASQVPSPHPPAQIGVLQSEPVHPPQQVWRPTQLYVDPAQPPHQQRQLPVRWMS